MIRKIKSALVTILAMSPLLFSVAMPAAVHAATDLQGSLNCGADLTVSTDGGCGAGNGQVATDTVNRNVTLALNLFSAVVGIIAVVMIIVGGIKYITSSGESSNVTSAKNTILYAVIGLIVVALAQIIVKFVLARFTGNA